MSNVDSGEMRSRKTKKRLTLSEHLAIRANANKEAKPQQDVPRYSLEDLKRLDALAVCNCPTCVERRRANTQRS